MRRRSPFGHQTDPVRTVKLLSTSPHARQRCRSPAAARYARSALTLVPLLLACLASAGAAAQEASVDTFVAVERGRVVFETCRVCHSLDPQAGDGIGPNLAGLLGRPAAARPEFPYSRVLAESGWVWSADQLDRFLAAPRLLLPNNRMAHRGITDDADRAALIAYLQQASRTAP